MSISEKIKKSKERIKITHIVNITSDLHNMAVDLSKKKRNLSYFQTIPVNIVASNETFFKETFSDLIDFDKKYLENTKSLIKRIGIKTEIEELFELTQESFTLGELLAYSLKYSSIESLIKTFEEISGLKIFDNIEELEEILDQYEIPDLINKNRPLDKSRIFRNLKEVYEIRNIICHDYLSTKHKLQLNYVELKEYILDAALLQEIILTLCSEKIYSTKYPIEFENRIPIFNSILVEKIAILEELMEQMFSLLETKAQKNNFNNWSRILFEYLSIESKFLPNYFYNYKTSLLPLIDAEIHHKIRLVDQKIKDIRVQLNIWD